VAVSDEATAPRGVLVLLSGGPGQPGVPFVSRLAGRPAGCGAGRLPAGDVRPARHRGRGAELPRLPVLLLAGGHDLSTPLADARAQAAHAPDGRLLVVPTAGHSVQSRAAGNPAQAEVRQFLDGGG
jgi:pimeloyl-ACP methyl ester carboxylesterase